MASLNSCHSQVPGCTDPMALNYDPNAGANDGSCLYAPISISPEISFELDRELWETSGLICWNNLIWTHNDSHDTRLYGMEPSGGRIREEQELKGVDNRDWEEISQDLEYIYIGDFGNNLGNRTDLHILRIAKSTLHTRDVKIDTIWFTYEDQRSFSPPGAQQTDFDCEAFVVSDDSLYLFTKQWITAGTAVYSLPRVPGIHTATLKYTYDIQGLVTGAVYLKQERLLLLTGYTGAMEPFLQLCYDFRDQDFFSGNVRRIRISLPFHQVEGIASVNGLDVYISNESSSYGNLFSHPQMLHRLDLRELLGHYLGNIPQ